MAKDDDQEGAWDLYLRARNLAPKDSDIARELKMFEKRMGKGKSKKRGRSAGKSSASGESKGILDADIGDFFGRLFKSDK